MQNNKNISFHSNQPRSIAFKAGNLKKIDFYTVKKNHNTEVIIIQKNKPRRHSKMFSNLCYI